MAKSKKKSKKQSKKQPTQSSKKKSKQKKSITKSKARGKAKASPKRAAKRRAVAGPAPILVPVDFSDSSLRALERASRLAASRGLPLLLLHVLPIAPLAIHGIEPMLPPPDLGGRIRELAGRSLARLAAEVRAKGLAVDTVLAVGAPGRVASDLADERGAALIVIGTRGLTGFRHLALGSTAEHVVRHAGCPVLTVRADDPVGAGPPSRILLPVDLASDPSRIGRELVHVFGPDVRRAKITLLYSDHLPPLLQPWVAELGLQRLGLETIREQLEERLEPAVAALAEQGFAVELRLREGEPASVIVDVARDEHVDLVALSTHGRTGAAHLLLGSTAERVVQHAGCAVLTLHEDVAPARA